ncbi:MAG: amidohydrolase [Thermoanaerobaculia bacterium]
MPTFEQKTRCFRVPKRILACLALMLGVWSCGAPTGSPDGDATSVASTLFLGGRILTLSGEPSAPTAMAIAGGRIAALGSDQEMESWRGAETVVVDLAGKILAPSFVDHHVHLLNIGISLLYANEPPPNFIDVTAFSSREALGEEIAARAATLDSGSWIVGKGWSQGAWGTQELPTHELLTRYAARHPVYLTRVDAHAGWLNALGLELAEIAASTPDPPGGALRRKPDSSPTGVLMERANELVLPLIPQPSDQQIRAAFRLGAEALAAQGVTEVFDAGFLAVPGIVDLRLDFERYLGLLVAEDLDSPLPLRVHLMIPAPSRFFEELVEESTGTRQLSPRLEISHVKLWADGAMGSRGAHLTHPFHDDPATRGVERMTAEELRSEAVKALDAGLDVASHAIGDQAVATVLDVYESILQERPDLEPTRLRIEHFSYAREEDFEKAADLGVLLSVQPNFVAPGDNGQAMEDSRVGTENSARVYAWGRLSKLGARLAFGSDYFTTPMPPLTTFYSAVTRRNLAGLPEEGWHPVERLDRNEALMTMTRLWAGGGLGATKGPLEVGARADFVVLDADPLQAEPSALLEIAVSGTYLGGEPTYSGAE